MSLPCLSFLCSSPVGVYSWYERVLKPEGTLEAIGQGALQEHMSESGALRNESSWGLSQECTELDSDSSPWVSACFKSCKGDPDLYATDLISY